MKGRKLSPSLRRDAPKTLEEWRALAAEIEGLVSSGKFTFQGLFASNSSGKPTLSTSSASDALVLRKINNNIRRAYGIRQTQRSDAIKLAKIALGEWTPKGIVAIDLKSCFETITPREITKKLRKDAKISSQTILLLEQFLSQAKRFGSNKYSTGLPRGILISSTLAELYLKKVDERISNTPGVYAYLRYVDDILAISSSSADSLYEKISETISEQGLKINLAKSRKRNAGCKCAFACAHSLGRCPCDPKCKCQLNKFNLDYVDYLGYKLIFNTGKSLEKTTDCFALIAKRKISKFKSRIEKSILDYKSNRDFSLLHDRITFLTSNVTVMNPLNDLSFFPELLLPTPSTMNHPPPIRFTTPQSPASINSSELA